MMVTARPLSPSRWALPSGHLESFQSVSDATDYAPPASPRAQPSRMAVHVIGFSCRRRRRAHGCDPFVVNHVPAAHIQRVGEWLAPP
jgi:hypothetical protein